MSQPFSLNKFEKEKRVIEMYLAGKTIREISKEVHMSFRDISKIIKAYEKKQNLALKEKLKIDSSHIKKKLSKNTQAFKLFHDGKKLTEVAIFLQIPAEKIEKLWSQFMRLEKMYECYEFYQDYEYDIPRLLSINNFIKKNNIQGKDIATVLKEAKDILHLQSYRSEIKNEIEKLKQTKNNYSLNQNTMKNLQPVPLGPLPRYYNW